MAKTRSMTRNKDHDHFHDDASSSSRKRFKTFDNEGVVPWSDLNNDVLFIVMMQLGVVDFVAFSGVCKSWRSFAISERNIFMASRPPMSMHIIPRGSNLNKYCQLEDFEGKMIKTIIPHSANRTCIGVTCGYLILFGRESRDFWLVNPITRHELHFPDYPIYGHADDKGLKIKAILVFSRSMSRWVFVVLHRLLSYIDRSKRKISFSIAGKKGWKHAFSPLLVLDLHAFNGKIYILHTNCKLGELRLDSNRDRRWTSLEIKNLSKPNLLDLELVSSGENLYVVEFCYTIPNKVLELDFDEMEWVSPKNTIGEYAVFLSKIKSSAVIKPKSWPDYRTQYKSFDYFIDHGKRLRDMVYEKLMWYFPQDCFNVNHVDL